jgi:hypothetical protein
MKINITADQLNAWAALITAAAPLGQDLVDLILNHAKVTLTDADYAELEARWAEDAARAAQNAGIVPPAA